MTGVWTHRPHKGETPGEDEGRDRGDDPTSPGIPKMASKPPEAQREVCTRFSLPVSERTIPADDLILNFWPSEPWDNPCLLFRPLSLWFSVMAAIYTNKYTRLSYICWYRAGPWGPQGTTVFLCPPNPRPPHPPPPCFLITGNMLHSASVTYPEFQQADSNIC